VKLPGAYPFESLDSGRWERVGTDLRGRQALRVDALDKFHYGQYALEVSTSSSPVGPAATARPSADIVSFIAVLPAQFGSQILRAWMGQ
jgi:hypothetical protein